MMISMSDPALMRIGDADRNAAVARLRQSRDAGHLTATEFQEREEQAHAARAQGDLDPIFADLPVIDAHQPPLSFDLYPHQAMAPTNEPDPPPQEGHGSPAAASQQGILPFLRSVPNWAWIAIVAAVIGLMVGGFSRTGWHGFWMPWWLIFFIPGIWNSDRRQRRRERRQRRDH